MILGIDEVGRGPWAGPLVIGAVILGDPQDEKWQDLADSKKLTAKKRELLSPRILESAKATGLGWVSSREIDELGLSESLALATKRAICDLLKITDLENIDKKLLFDEIIIDGTVNFLKNTLLEQKVTTLKKADDKIKEVSAASIIAKVARDNYMKNLATKYPEYGFEKHVGYGTAAHKAALLKFGPCPEHRFSFKSVAELVKKEPATAGWLPGAHRIVSSATGKKAEEIVAEYLIKQGHKIIARNHKTRFYEIDIVSATKDHIYFTEVKYRKNSRHGEPLEFIDKKKQKQMSFAAEAFMKYLAQRLKRDQETLPSPILAAAAVEGTDFKLQKWFEIQP